MVHSVELLFDDETDAAVRGVWNTLAENGIRSLAAHRSPSNRPHVTVTVAEELPDEVDEALCEVLDRLPVACVLGAPMLFGAGRAVTLVRLVVPSAELLELHAHVHDLCAPYMAVDVLPHAVPGQWTPHVTLARRIPVDQLPVAMSLVGVTGDISATASALRHWDGNAKVVHPIG